MRAAARLAAIFAIGGAILATPVMASNPYTCGDAVVYQTTCVPGVDNNKKCIRPQTNLGCCFPGSCTNDGVCNIPGSVPLSVCAHDSDPCTSRGCTTAGSGGTPHHAQCQYPADPSTAGNNCTSADGNECSIDECNAQGVCTNISNVSCAQDFDRRCASANTCNPANGNCVLTPVAQGQPCDDRNECSIGEVCNDGECGTGPGAGAKNPGATCYWNPSLGRPEFCNPGTCADNSYSCNNRSAIGAGGACTDLNTCTSGSTCVFDGSLNGSHKYRCAHSACGGSTCAQCGSISCSASLINDPTYPCGCSDKQIIF